MRALAGEGEGEGRDKEEGDWREGDWRDGAMDCCTYPVANKPDCLGPLFHLQFGADQPIFVAWQGDGTRLIPLTTAPMTMSPASIPLSQVMCEGNAATGPRHVMAAMSVKVSAPECGISTAFFPSPLSTAPLISCGRLKTVEGGGEEP